MVIIKHVVVCSSCGKETPAYAEFIGYNEKSFKRRTRIELEQWVTRQLSLFENQPQEIYFNTPIGGMSHFTCPYCGTVLVSGKYKFQVVIRADKKQIKIMRGIDFEDYFSISWIKEFQTSEFDLYETITFNLRNGHVYVSLENSAGVKRAVRDISNADVRDMSDDPIFELVRTYKPVYRELKRCFRKFWVGTLPFSPHELDLEKYILLTKFVGFNRDFYNSLPFSITGSHIERSFAGIAKRLHNANDVPALFEMSRLPNIKTVRKVIFSNPALLFYQKELEAFWQILNDPNFFCTFLESRNLYRGLSTLRKYPGLTEFYKEFAAEVSQKALCNCLSKGNYFIHSYAQKYLLLNDYEKKIERKKWSSSSFSKTEPYDAKSIGAMFSIPIPPQNQNTDALECRIGDYFFGRLCNSKEYITAGAELRNCLRHWEMFDGDVYGVSKGGEYVAAIEIRDGTIIQAHTYRNGEMNTDRPLFSAFCVWKERNGFTECDDDSAENEG